MNTAAPPTRAERLTYLRNGALFVRLAIARDHFLAAGTPFARAKAMDEIDALRAEIQRRGMQVPA